MSSDIRILISDAISEDGVRIFQKAGFHVDMKTKLSRQELSQEISQYDWSGDPKRDKGHA